MIDSLDIGGGIGIIYEQNKDKVFKISDYALLVEKNFADLGIEIIIEPGRFFSWSIRYINFKGNKN